MTPGESAAAALRLLVDANDEVADVHGAGGMTSNVVDVYRNVHYLTSVALVHAVLALRPAPVALSATPMPPTALYVDRDGDIWAETPTGLAMWGPHAARRGEPTWTRDRGRLDSIERAHGPLVPAPWPVQA